MGYDSKFSFQEVRKTRDPNCDHGKYIATLIEGKPRGDFFTGVGPLSYLLVGVYINGGTSYSGMHFSTADARRCPCVGSGLDVLSFARHWPATLFLTKRFCSKGERENRVIRNFLRGSR